MEEIKLFYDKEKKKEITSDITFDVVKAGETSFKKIFLVNLINFTLDVNLELIGKDIILNPLQLSLKAEIMKELIFELKPRITSMKPITAKLKIQLNYVVI